MNRLPDESASPLSFTADQAVLNAFLMATMTENVLAEPRFTVQALPLRCPIKLRRHARG